MRPVTDTSDSSDIQPAFLAVVKCRVDKRQVVKTRLFRFSERFVGRVTDNLAFFQSK